MSPTAQAPRITPRTTFEIGFFITDSPPISVRHSEQNSDDRANRWQSDKRQHASHKERTAAGPKHNGSLCYSNRHKRGVETGMPAHSPRAMVHMPQVNVAVRARTRPNGNTAELKNRSAEI